MQFRIPDYETIIDIHNIIINEYGGLSGVPHPQRIEAAIARPQSYMHYEDSCDIYLVAAIILDSLARNHAFADGNKRTALTTMIFMYNLNREDNLGYGLAMNADFEQLVLDVAIKKPAMHELHVRVKDLFIKYSIEGLPSSNS